MATNYPGPYEIRIFYTVTYATGGALTHEQRLNVVCAPEPDPGTEFDAIYVQNAPLSTTTLDSVVDQWVTYIKTQFNSGSVSIDYAELWKYTAGTFLSEFVSSYTIGVAGTSGSSVVPCQQSIFVFRSKEGGIMKISLLETVNNLNNVPIGYSGLSAAQKDIVDYVINVNFPSSGAGNWFYARDTSQPFSFVKLYLGQFEKLYKKRFR